MSHPGLVYSVDVMVVDHAALGGTYTRLFRPRLHTGLTKTTKEEVDGRDHKGTMPEIEARKEHQ